MKVRIPFTKIIKSTLFIEGKDIDDITTKLNESNNPLTEFFNLSTTYVETDYTISDLEEWEITK